jgi:hypothetical protein
MQEQSWIVGHLGWLIGAAVLPSVGYFGKQFVTRWNSKRAPRLGTIDHTPACSVLPPGRKSSLPTAGDLQDAYNLLSTCYRADLLRNYVGLDVRWPGILVETHASPEASGYADLRFRFDGENTNASVFRCQVKAANYPGIDAAAGTEAKAWVQGKIAGIDDSCITLTDSTVEFQ